MESDFGSGRQALLQVLAIMRDDEEFQGKYGEISKVISTRKEASITGLCNMLARMKRELDAKNKCCDLLQDAADGWSIMVEDRRRLVAKISSLETECDELKKKVEGLEEREEFNDWEESRFKEGKHEDEESSNFSPAKEEDESVRRDSEHERAFFNDDSTARTGSTVADIVNGRSIPDQSSSARFSTSKSESRLAETPYEKLNWLNYNPTQFYQRQSTVSTAVKRPRKGAVGRGRKKADGSFNILSSTPSATSTAGRGKRRATPRPRKRKNTTFMDSMEDISAIEAVESPETVDVSNDNDGTDEPGGSVKYTEENCFDWTSNFLDETN